MAAGAGLVSHGLHLAEAGSELNPVVHWLRDVALATPGSIVVVGVARWVSRSLAGWFRLGWRGGDGLTRRLLLATTVGLGAGIASVPAKLGHDLVLHSGHSHAIESVHLLADGGVVAGAALLVALAVPGAGGLSGAAPVGEAPVWTYMSAAWRGVRAHRPSPRRLIAGGLSLAVALPLAIGDPQTLPASAQDGDEEDTGGQSAAGCGPGSSDRSYNVSAINVDIPWNRWGHINAHGQMYVLDRDKEAVKNWHVPLADDPANDPAGNRRLRPRPLVLRANAGECVRIDFTNELNDNPGEGTGLPTDPRASISVRGIPFEAHTSAGGSTGYNDDTTVPNDPGENQTSYFWHAPEEGIHMFRDEGAPAGAEGDGGSLSTGLYGAFVIEPAGSEWLHPRNGEPLYAGTADQSGEPYTDAMINPPDEEAFRETVQISQDEILGLGESEVMGFNYGGEPLEPRTSHGCPDCANEEAALSSWPYGDPGMVKLASGLGSWEPDPDAAPEEVEDCGLGTPGFDADSCWTSNVAHAYPNDPTKVRFAQAGVKETHVFHMHTHQWPQQEGLDKDESVTIDSQSFGPMEGYTAEVIGGAGSVQGTVGDSIFHCHLYPHFSNGFWSLFRVHDVEEDGTTQLPDHTNVQAVQPLPDDADPPPEPTADNPGFPRFIPGEFGWRAPQPPNTVTDPDGSEATRIVAGEELMEQDVETETAVRQRMFDTEDPNPGEPGAPFVDPCPPDAREVTYDVSLIQLPVTYNREGWYDSQARIFVLDEHVDEVMAGEREPEPLFVRVNEGDCVNWNLTVRVPNWFGNDAFLQLKQTNMYGQHVHLLKFDVLASDGSANGWNYQQAAFTRQLMDYNEAVLAGTEECTEEPGGCAPEDPAEWGPEQWQPAAREAANDPGQTITARWYAESDLRTVFTHDHQFAGIAQNRGIFSGLIVEKPGADFRDPQSGEFYQPIDDPDHGDPCEPACSGDAEGVSMDVIEEDGSSFREYGLFVQDFVYLTREGGDPQDPADAVEPPNAPEPFPDAAHGVTGINLRNAHLSLRYTRQDGTPVDPAYVFSSRVHDDPLTPVLEAYENDDIRFRVIQGAHEEQHMVGLHGHRWRRDVQDPTSSFTNAQSIGISEAFNFEGDDIRCRGDRECRGDYLYGGFALDSLYAGMWGIFRIHGKTVPDLLPLPDNPVPEGDGDQSPDSSDVSGRPPAPPETPGHPCPTHAPTRFYDVVALDAQIDYNRHGDHDPYGLTYALAEDVDDIRAGDKNPEPLVLQANEGDCLQVTLSNEISESWFEHGELGRRDGDAPQFGEPLEGHPAGRRVSLHPQMLDYDVRGSDGATIGFNPDQTVGPGEEITYRWYVPDVSPGELGGTNLLEFGDVRGHRHHGLYAALNIQPREATAHDPVTGERIEQGEAADIRVPGQPDYREFTALVADGLNIRDPNGVPYPDEGADVAEPEAEDAGERALNYRTAPYRHRIGFDPPLDGTNPDGDALAGAYSSERHGDPDTPIFRALIGDGARLRLLEGADKFRPQSHSVIGHNWRVEPNDDRSRLVGTRGKLNTGQHWNAEIGPVGAGRQPADWRLGSEVGHFHRSGGVWGLLRSYRPPEDGSALVPAEVADRDDPRQVEAPVLPLELDQLVVTTYHDEDRSGSREFDEDPVAGAQVAAVRSGFESPTATTGGDGQAELSVEPGAWTLDVTPPDGWERGYTGDVSVSTGGDNEILFVDVPLRTVDEPGPGTDPPDTDPDPTTKPPVKPGDDGVGPIPPPDDVTTGVHRLFGVDRIATAVAISRERFREAGDADSVVLARADEYPDALAGAPLADDRNAPLLLTNSDELHPLAEDELIRVLDAGTVHLLGGTAALSDEVASAVTELGYNVERHGGANRFETSIAIARDGLGDPDPLLLATGLNFPDALTAGAAAANASGAVLLTADGELPGSVARYLDGRGNAEQIAIGGPSARAAPDAEPVFGRHRWATAVAVAERFFTDPATVGVASGHTFPDALAGGAHMGTHDGPVLLADTDRLPWDVRDYLDAQRDSLTVGFLYGGRAVLAEAVLTELRTFIE